jgi:NSS family neurotransmitter:Na+ symporter
MIAYASYFKQGTNLTRTAFSVTAMTFLVAILSGVVIFPAVFSVEGLEPTAGPTLIFETLPFVFHDMPMPQLWSALFFLLISMAALTSTISFHEVLTQYLQENHSMERRKAAIVVSLGSAVAATLCLYVPVLFDGFDMATADYLMPIGGLFTAIFAGWVFDRKIFRAQISNDGTLRARMFLLLVFALKWVCPILLTVSFIYNLVV